MSTDTCDDLALHALQAMIMKDMPTVQADVNTLNDQGYLLRAAAGWIDCAATLAAERSGHDLATLLTTPIVIIPELLDNTTGQPVPIDTATHNGRPHVTWAMRLFTARAAYDKDTWDALIHTLPADAGPYIGAVLKVCADMITGENAAGFTLADAPPA